MAGEVKGVPVPGLATLRRRAGYSQEELARRAGVGKTTIYRLEQGANAHFYTIEKLARALKTSRKRLMSAPEQESTQGQSGVSS
jgi:transcriptional regulator with XRE-family HTH domain